MKLIDYFGEFLRNTVNLNKTRIEQLDHRVDKVTEALKSAPELDGMVLDTIPQGSWAHRTIIRPAADLEFDADFLVQLAETTDWKKSPTKYADAVWQALKNHTTYGSMTTRKNRCVRVTYANDCHIDVVPYIVEWSGREVIVNRTTGEFEQTYPTGFTEWLQDKDDYTGGDLRKVLRLLKYLRDSRHAFEIKSVLLTTLAGSVVDGWRNANGDYYRDVPTTLVNVVEDLDARLQSNPFKPHITDPSCPATSFDHRWTELQYRNFREAIHKLAPRLRTAYDLAGAPESVVAWQEIFGPSFPSSVTKSAVTASASAAPSPSTENRAPQERFIEEMFPVEVAYQVRLTAETQEPSYPNRRARRRSLRSRAGRVTKGRSITFTVVATDVPEPYDIYWKVRNHGLEARLRNQLRGEIEKRGKVHSEQTSYAGHHFVEVYVVKDGVCVAQAHERVDIPDVRGG